MERFEAGLRVLRRALQLDLRMAANLLDQEGYLAGSDRVRVEALHRAFADPDAHAMFCARGGYGSTRLLGTLDPERLRQHPKTIVGFSDITALLCWAYVRAGVRGIHGPVITQLSTLHPEDVDRLVDMLRGEVPSPLCASQGTVLRGGTVEGPLIPANLEVLRSLVGTRYLPPMQGAILALEEIGERPYRVDRSLTQLLSSGALRGVRGIVLGQFVNCDPPDDQGIGPTAIQAAIERLGTLGIPLVSGFEFGHDETRHAALPFGGQVRLLADDCTLEFLEPAAT